MQQGKDDVLEFTSDGMGNMTEAVLDHGGARRGEFHAEQRGDRRRAPTFDDDGEDNPFAGLSTHRDAKSIPDAFAHAFNKVDETEYQGITYRYRMLTFLEQHVLGTNPFTIEALQVYNEDDDVLDMQEFAEHLKVLRDDDPETFDGMVEQAGVHRDKVLLKALIEMRVGDQRLPINAEIIASMKSDVRDHLHEVIIKGGTADHEAVRRFSGGTQSGPVGRRAGVSADD